MIMPILYYIGFKGTWELEKDNNGIKNPITMEKIHKGLGVEYKNNSPYTKKEDMFSTFI